MRFRAQNCTGGFPCPVGFKLFQFAERFQSHFVQADFRVEAQRRLQILRLQRAPRQFIQPLPERVHFVRLKAQARRHRVAAVPHEQIVALAQRGGQIKSRDAAARTAPFAAFAAENDRGPVKLLQHARRDDADHADVPEQLPLDDDEIRLRIEF